MTHSRVVRGLMREMLLNGALNLRDVDNGEEPFLYSSGNRGPGYVSVKGLIGFTTLFRALAANLAAELVARDLATDVHFIAGNVTGGVPPAIYLADALSLLLGRDVPFVYVRDTRKAGGLREHVTGLDAVPPHAGKRGLVVEELVNFATTTVNSARLLRDLGYDVTHAACLLNYDHAANRAHLAEAGVGLVELFTLTDLLAVAREDLPGRFEPRLVDAYAAFLADPAGWMAAHGLERAEKGGTR